MYGHRTTAGKEKPEQDEGGEGDGRRPPHEMR